MKLKLIHDRLALDSDGELYGHTWVWSGATGRNKVDHIWAKYRPHKDGFDWVRPGAAGGGSFKDEELSKVAARV